MTSRATSERTGVSAWRAGNGPVLGLVLNPVAGLGGPAGLKGSDGREVQNAARARGSVPRAGSRAEHALQAVARSSPNTVILTAAGSMGADAVRAAGLTAHVVYTPASADTTADDTRQATLALVAAGATLLLFAGGDGTARDVCLALPEGCAALGIPAGVKMYSACFAVSPAAAGVIAARWVEGSLPTQQREVLDVSEDQVRRGRVDPTLFGIMPVPFVAGRTQARKAATAASELDAVRSAARGVVRAMQPGVAYLLGPGSTTAEVAAQLEVRKTPLGVDVVRDGETIIVDAAESQLLRVVADGPARAVVTVIGGQGFLLGRGNQQISAAVLRAIGPDPLLVVATEEKLIALHGAPLLVDTGDPEIDAALAGYVEVITGAAKRSVYRVAAPDGADPSNGHVAESESPVPHQQGV